MPVLMTPDQQSKLLAQVSIMLGGEAETRLLNHLMALKKEILALTRWYRHEAKPIIHNETMVEKVVALRNTESGEVYVRSAWFLKKYPLCSPDECLNEGAAEPCPCAELGDGCPMTGWYQITHHPDYEEHFEVLVQGTREFLGWANLPAFQADGEMVFLSKLEAAAPVLLETLAQIGRAAVPVTSAEKNVRALWDIQRKALEVRALVEPIPPADDKQ